MDSEEFLAHYGVKGMKWGVRRAKRKAEVTEARRALKSGKSKAAAKQAAIEYKIAKKKKRGEEQARRTLNKANLKYATELRRGVRTKTGRATVALWLVSPAAFPVFAGYVGARVGAHAGEKYWKNRVEKDTMEARIASKQRK
jgi:hypothetical protein